MEYQLIIIGGGASGLAAALTAASYGMERVAVLERQPRVGKKILATGNGRCNLSHMPIAPEDFSGSVPVADILAEFGDASLFFESLGLCCRTDAQGRVYPYSMTAGAVLDALRSACERCGVEEHCNTCVTSLTPCGSRWRVGTEQGEFLADAVIFAAGGYAAPQLGTDGSAWELLRKLSIPLAAPKPILCPIRSDADCLRPLKGLRARAEVTLYDRNHAVSTTQGEVQFTETALSGICLFDLSGLVDVSRCGDFRIALNLCPERSEGEITAMLYAFQAVRFGADCEAMLSGIVQKPLARRILKECGIRAATPCDQLDGKKIAAISQKLHCLQFPVTGLADWKQAQATAGGVMGSALDAHLQVKVHPNLYITGEAADVHSICGGYHLHWSWASGVWAAKHIAERSLCP
ncbi:MAG: aminoacetone oxidase family FAD-binding enzyme [Ruminococcus sp.]|nr:aminoacetone oxidase family FAD-binding enzyme [Ruminococcus sp.]